LAISRRGETIAGVILLGYSHFVLGTYYKGTPGFPYRGNADFLYVQCQWRF